MFREKYKNKPTQKMVDMYCKKIEDFLFAHNLKIQLELGESPVVVKSYLENEHIEDEYVWIRKIILNLPQNKKLEMMPPRNGFDEDITDRELWEDAWCIQNGMYKQLNVNINGADDAYWKLWEKLSKNK